VKLDSILSIHDADHDLTALIHAELTGNRWRETGKFQVPYVKLGDQRPEQFPVDSEACRKCGIRNVGEVTAAK